ncbi:hypothetical protein BGZ75_009034 [Mortierella antarctica]|nr:hypothetical protein BGZ75_009034 [Mortierella antarctica]
MTANHHHPQFGHAIPPLRFPGQQPQQQQQQQQFGGVHHGQQPLLPTNAAAFHAMAHANNNPYGIRTSSTGSPTIPALTSPTQPPNRQLPPIPISLDSLSSYKSSESNSSSSGSSDSSANISPSDTLDRANSLRSGFKELRKRAEELQNTNAESDYIKTYNKGVDLAIAATANITTGSTLMTQGMAVANKVLDNPKVNDVLSSIEKNPVLNHLVQLADKLVDIGKTVPFIAPAFVILKLIIDVEQRARDTDAKCTDLLERINFMVSNITVLEKVKAVEPLVAVISRMNETLKRAASLIQAYRKQGAIARRLNISNSQNFVQMAASISACSQDLMLSLQIQQTGDISVLTRSVPVDSQDEEAKSFVMAHGGQSVINNDPALVEEFAKKMHLTMSDQVMDQMQSSMEELLEENQSRIETLLKENSSNTVAETIKAMAAEARELEAEQRLVCLQCDKEYRKSANGPEACSFHKSMKTDGSFSCCGNNAPCAYGSHRPAHHCEYPYTNFYDYAFGILGYTDTHRHWATVRETDLLTNDEMLASVSELVRWRSRHEKITQPMMVIRVGFVRYDNPYYFQAFDVELLKTTNAALRETRQTLIFKTNTGDDEYAMAEWILDAAGTIAGVRISAKVATNDTPTVSEVPIDPATVSLSGEVRSISKARFKVYKPTEPYKFPEPVHVGHSLRSTPLREVREFKPRTQLPLIIIPEAKMVANSRGAYTRMNADKFQGTLRIFNKSPPSSQTFVTLASCKAEYRFVGEDAYQDVESLDLGHVKFPATIEPTQSLDLPFEAIVPRAKAQADLMQSCWDWAMVALHHPIRVRLTFKDIEGEELVYIQEYIHKPSSRMAVKDNEKDLLFLHIDDILENSRYTVRVKKATDEDHVLDVNGNQFKAQDLHKIVYKAEKTGVTEVNICSRENGSNKWDAWALVDLSCRRVYGIKVLLVPGNTRSTKTTAALGYAPCPLYGNDDESALEVRPQRYAEEKIVFPVLEPEEHPVVVVDDDVDDEKTPAVTAAPVIQEAAPVVAIAAAASASVTKALTEVSKNAASLDSAAFAASMSSLERRIESLDANVARMATALEKLVDILSH